MKKKLLTGLFACGLLLGVAACAPQSETYSSKVLEDKESAAWALHGQFLLADDTENGWNGKSNELYEKSFMTATSIKAVSELDKGVADKLNERKVKYLYMYEGAQFGMNDAGWKADFHDDKDMYKANGSYVFKAVKLSKVVDEDDPEIYVYSEDQWIHDPKVGFTEALTESIFMPTWQEKADEWGLSWASNLVVTSGAGKYTVIAAQFEAEEGKPQFGLAAILKEAATGGQEYEKQPTWQPAEHTYGVIGSFAASGWATDVAMTLVEDHYEAAVELAENDEFKIRTDGNWDTLNIGAGALDKDASESTLSGTDNIVVATAGNYLVKLYFEGKLNLPRLVAVLRK